MKFRTNFKKQKLEISTHDSGMGKCIVLYAHVEYYIVVKINILYLGVHSYLIKMSFKMEGNNENCSIG